MNHRVIWTLAPVLLLAGCASSKSTPDLSGARPDPSVGINRQLVASSPLIAVGKLAWGVRTLDAANPPASGPPAKAVSAFQLRLTDLTFLKGDLGAGRREVDVRGLAPPVTIDELVREQYRPVSRIWFLRQTPWGVSVERVFESLNTRAFNPAEALAVARAVMPPTRSWLEMADLSEPVDVEAAYRMSAMFLTPPAGSTEAFQQGLAGAITSSLVVTNRRYTIQLLRRLLTHADRKLGLAACIALTDDFDVESACLAMFPDASPAVRAQVEQRVRQREQVLLRDIASKTLGGMSITESRADLLDLLIVLSGHPNPSVRTFVAAAGKRFFPEPSTFQTMPPNP